MGWTVEIDTSEVERDWNDALGALSDGIRKGVDNGVTEAAAQARTGHRYQDRTGALTASIVGRLETSTRGGAVGVIEATSKHAIFVESGTAPHEILPRRARALRFEVGGDVVVTGRVQHPGQPSMPFIGPAVIKAEAVVTREVEIAVEVAARIMDR